MPNASGAPDWDAEGRDWPHRPASRFVEAGGITWHVQQMGEGPQLLLVHGTGAATHSWRGLAPLLAPHFALTIIDLPGHGFTGMPADGRIGLGGMSALTATLVDALGLAPAFAAGHSAGAAILARMCLDRTIAPRVLFSINGAFLPFSGIARHLFPPLAKLLFVNPLVVGLTARRGSDRAAVARLLAGTGSRLDAAGVDLYARLFGAPRHVRAALGMMASWRLDELVAELPGLAPHLILIASSEDSAVPADQAFRVKALVPGSEVIYLRHVGHLAHEEDPAAVSRVMLALALGIGPGSTAADTAADATRAPGGAS